MELHLYKGNALKAPSCRLKAKTRDCVLANVLYDFGRPVILENSHLNSKHILLPFLFRFQLTACSFGFVPVQTLYLALVAFLPQT